MLVKFYNQYETDVNGLLSDDVSISTVRLSRNGETLRFVPISTIITVSMFSYETEDDVFNGLIVETGHPKAATVADDVAKTLTITAEDGIATQIYTVEFEVITASDLDPHVFKLVDNNTDQTVEVLYGAADKHVIRLPWYDNAIAWIDVDISTDYSSDTTASYISIDGLDPDGDNVFGASITAFDGAETVALDAAFIYIKLTNTTSSIYIKVVKSSGTASDVQLDTIYREFLWKYAYLHRDRLAFVLSSPLTVSFMRTLEAASTLDDAKVIISNAGYTYFDVSNYLSQLIDQTETQRIHDNHRAYAYSQSFTNYTGFTSLDIENPAVTIAQTLFDSLSDQTDIPLSLLYWEWLAEITTILSADVTTDAHLAEVSINTLLLLDTPTVSFIRDIVLFIKENALITETAAYEIGDDDLITISNTLVNVAGVKATGSINQLSESSITGAKVFFKVLHLLVENDGVITKNNW